MADYQDFRNRMDELEAFIAKTETKEIEGEPHITIDDSNKDEFMNIMTGLISIATSDDNYVDEIMAYLSQIDQRITDKNMIAKFIPLFAAIQSLVMVTKKFSKEVLQELINDPEKEVSLFDETTTPAFDDWVFEKNTFDGAPLDMRFGKVVGVTTENNVTTIKINAPLINEIVEWEDATFVVIPDMEKVYKKYQEKYTRTF